MASAIAVLMFLASGQLDASLASDVYSFEHNVEYAARQAVTLQMGNSLDSEITDELLRRVGRLQAKANRLKEAELTLALIIDDSERASLTEVIARGYARRGDVDACKRLISATPDNHSWVNNWRLSVSHIVVDDLCGQLQFRDAVDVANLQATKSTQVGLLRDVAEHAARLGAPSVFNEILPQLDVAERCITLSAAAVALSAAGNPHDEARRYLQQAVEYASKIEPAAERWPVLNRLCRCLDVIGDRSAADALMAHIADVKHRAYCAMSRAEVYAQRGARNEATLYVGMARQLSPQSGILGVLKSTMQAGDIATAAELIERFSSEETRESDIREGVLEPALEHGDFESARTAARLVAPPLGRATALLMCAELLLSQRGDRASKAAKVSDILTEVDSLGQQLDRSAHSLRVRVKLAMMWHSIGDDVASRKLLQSLVGTLHDGERPDATKPDRTSLFPLADALDAVEMQDELDVVLKMFFPPDALRWRIDRLCDRGHFAEALTLIGESKSAVRTELQAEVLRRAAKARSLEWALDQAKQLEGSLDAKFDLLLVVLEEWHDSSRE